MSHAHPSRSWRGCAMCEQHKRRGKGRAEREPFSVRRRRGKSRRLTRRGLTLTERFDDA